MIPHFSRFVLRMLAGLWILCLFSFSAYAQHGYERADLVVIHKAAHQLELWRSGETILRFRVALGFDPVGHKQYQGDGRTPEGVYTIIEKKKKSGFHRALMLNYPNESDRQSAAAKGLTPGGNIAIHGMPNGTTPDMIDHPNTDWTEGCIALTDPEIDAVWARVDTGTPVLIMP